MVYILNFNVSRDLSEIEYYYDNDRQSNLDLLLNDFVTGDTNWSVPKSASPGDIAVFMCAKSAKANIGLATSHIPNSYSQDFFNFAAQEKKLYKQYSGNILGYGIVASYPEYDDITGWLTAVITPLYQFSNLIPYDDYKSFIYINRMGSVTNLKDDQWERLKWLINKYNPQTFQNVNAPFSETLDKEFDHDVENEYKKTLSQLSKEAKRKASQPTVSNVQTKEYHRDPTIAAYVKKRANGKCQLCGEPAPFIDKKNGIPYLECHHIEWLSEGGMDSPDNCVALCPNCHRKMHCIKDPEDIKKLKAYVANS